MPPQQGASNLSYAGIFIVAAMLVAAILFLVPSSKISAIAAFAICQVTNLASSKTCTIVDADDEDYKPDTYTTQVQGINFNKALKVSIVQGQDGLVWKIALDNNGKYKATLLDEKSLGAYLGAGFDVGPKNLGAKAYLEAASNIGLQLGDEVTFDNSEDLNAFLQRKTASKLAKNVPLVGDLLEKAVIHFLGNDKVTPSSRIIGVKKASEIAGELGIDLPLSFDTTLGAGTGANEAIQIRQNDDGTLTFVKNQTLAANGNASNVGFDGSSKVETRFKFDPQARLINITEEITQVTASGVAANPEETQSKGRHAATRNVLKSGLIDIQGLNQTIINKNWELDPKDPDYSQRVSAAYLAMLNPNLESVENVKAITGNAMTKPADNADPFQKYLYEEAKVWKANYQGSNYETGAGANIKAGPYSVGADVKLGYNQLNASEVIWYGAPGAGERQAIKIDQ